MFASGRVRRREIAVVSSDDEDMGGGKGFEEIRSIENRDARVHRIGMESPVPIDC